MIRRSIILSNTIFQNVELIIKIGIKVGLIFGLGVAIGGNLIVYHVMDSYNQLVHQSLLGINGSLQLTTRADTWNELRRELDFSNSGTDFSYFWQSSHPVKITFKQGFKQRSFQIRYQLLQNDFLVDRLLKKNICRLEKGESLYSFGNRLLFKMIPDFNLDKKIEISSKRLGNRSVRFIQDKNCQIPTGMMVDYPILFLTWESLDQDAIGWSDPLTISFNTDDRNTSDRWYQELTEKCLDVVRTTETGSELFKCKLNDVYQSPKMAMADNWSRQAENISLVIRTITTILALLIVFFGFSMLRAFKKEVIHTLIRLGNHQLDVFCAFSIKGAIYGLYSAAIGVMCANIIKIVIQRWHLIPFEPFFVEWEYLPIIGILVSVSLGIGFFSGFVMLISLHLDQTSTI